MFKLMVLAVLLISSSACLAEDMKLYEGIWQNTTNELSYYSIRAKDQQVVLIDLSGIELTRSTLASAYIGSNIVNGSILMSQVSPPTAIISLGLTFQSSNEGTIVPGCVVSETVSGATCDVAPITIRKVF